MVMIHLHLFHQIVLQETFDVLQVFFPSSKIGHVLSREINMCHLKHHVQFTTQTTNLQGNQNIK